MINIVTKLLVIILPLGFLVSGSVVNSQVENQQRSEIIGDDHTRVLVLDLERKVNELQDQVTQLQQENQEILAEMEKLRIEIEQIKEMLPSE